MEEKQQFETRLLPIMREGIEVVKMIVFKELKDALLAKEGGNDAAYRGRLAGCVLNDLFGITNSQEPFATFHRENLTAIENAMLSIPTMLEKLRIPLTDALRMQFLCDGMDGVEDQAMLDRAAKLGILITDRDLPLPHHFMDLVRRLGASYGLLFKPSADS